MPTMHTTTSSRCGSCGGLACTCRPRFVDQQRLDADDLNALVEYTRTRARLQNQLTGWGVVCGLAVGRSREHGQVTVAPGRALSPCGEDIVVPDAQPVSICDLIACWASPGTIHCQPGEPTTHPDRVSKWELRIRYVERPMTRRSAARSTVAAACSCGSRGAPTIAGACGCGAGSNCGCSSGGSSCGCGTRTTRPPGGRGATPQAVCDPGVICDSFCFEVRPHVEPEELVEAATNSSRLFRQVRAPLGDLVIEPTAVTAADQRVEVIGRLKDLSKFELLPDDLREEAATIVEADTTSSRMFDSARNLLARSSRVVGRAAVCEAINPPCPPAADDDSVLVAVVTVTPGRCEITDICTAGRRLVVSGAAVQYWASLVFETNPLEELCCGPRTQARYARTRKGWASTTEMADDVLDEVKLAVRNGLGRWFGRKD